MQTDMTPRSCWDNYLTQDIAEILDIRYSDACAILETYTDSYLDSFFAQGIGPRETANYLVGETK